MFWKHFQTVAKTFLFSQYSCVQRIRGFDDNALYKFTILTLTYSYTRCLL